MRSCKAFTLMLWLLSVPASAASVLTVQVRAGDEPVSDAVISLHQAHSVRASGAQAVVDQIGSEFVPRVSAIQVGTSVAFPNSDATRHQVYSFSPAKRFSLPLYSGTPPAPLLFDQAGVVSLGCNIHDWMQGFIVVLDTPYFAKSDVAGEARIELPAGDYRLQLWHERLQGEFSQSLKLDAAASLRLDVALRPPPPPRGSDRLRALQNKLRERGTQD